MRRTVFKKVNWYISWSFIRILKIFSEDLYKKKYRRLLKNMGMDIAQDEYYIDPSAFFDNYDYSLIHIGNHVTISREVLLLTHDYSLYVGLRTVDNKYVSGIFLKEITISDNCFIGARVTILPGTHIGKNCIIGAGSVIKGDIPANSIVIGNPAQIVGNVTEWAVTHIKKKDFEFLNY